MQTPKTDEQGNVIPETNELTPEIKPDVKPDADPEKKQKTRKEKTAEKLGLTVEQFDEMRNNGDFEETDDRIAKIEKQNEQLLQALKPTLQKQQEETLKSEFETAGIEGVTFDDFKSQLDAALELGAPADTAKAKILEKLKGQGQENIDNDRSQARRNANLPPASENISASQRMQILTQEQYSTLLQDKGVEAYKKYNEFCEKHNDGKYYQ